MSISNSTVNGTGVLPSSNYIPTANQFFCQLTKNDTQCISSKQFSQQPFDLLCPSGDCWSDCQVLDRLYAPFPDGLTYTTQINYGVPPNLTFWPLCAGLANVTQAILDRRAPASDTDPIKKFFSNNTALNVRNVAAATTECLQQTCSAARHSDDCTQPCQNVNLLQNRTFVQLDGTSECFRSLCANVSGLPFANQDVVGIGVTASYVIQNFLVLWCWVVLAIGEAVTLGHNQRTQERRVTKSWDKMLEGMTGFHAAQCYFSIPIAIASFFNNPFTLDPLNAFALMPVAINGFLPVIFTLAVSTHYTGLKTWYPIILTNISFVLNSILFWAVYRYLTQVKTVGAALKAPAYQSLGGIDVCGGLTAIALCLQFQDDSPPAVLLQNYGPTAWLCIQLAPLAWAWGAISLVVLNIRRIGKSDFWNNHGTPSIQRVANMSAHGIPALRWFPSYWISSAIFLVGMFFEGVMFHAYITLDLTDLSQWSFGQVVAITLWVPPLVDYLHLQFDSVREARSARLSGAEWKTSEHDPLITNTTPQIPQGDNKQSPQTSHEPLGRVSRGVELHHVQNDRYRPVDSFADDEEDGYSHVPRPMSAWSSYEQRPASPHMHA